MGFTYLYRERRFAIAIIDRFFAHGHIAPFAIPAILGRVIRVDFEAVQVLHIAAHVGYAPCNVGVMTHDDTGCGGKCEPNHIERAIFCDRETVESDLIPDGWHLNA